MSPAITKAHYLMRRELWENKGGALWTPVSIAIAVSVLILLALLLGKGTVGSADLDIDKILQSMDRHGLNEDIDAPVKIIDFNSGTLVVSSENDLGLGFMRREASPEGYLITFQHGAVIVFEFVAFIVAIVYLLGALFNDRKDRSILFWKSLPISETSNVLTKLLFAVTVIPFFALVCSIPVQIVGGAAIAWGFSLSDSFTFWGTFSHISLIQVFLVHTVLLLVIAIKSLPLYSWLLFASSVSKRSPLLIAAIIPLAIAALEPLIFDTNYFSTFIASLFFQGRFNADWLAADNIMRGIVEAMRISLPQLVKITIISGLFIGGAIWCRNNRYEI